MTTKCKYNFILFIKIFPSIYYNSRDLNLLKNKQMNCKSFSEIYVKMISLSIDFVFKGHHIRRLCTTRKINI